MMKIIMLPLRIITKTIAILSTFHTWSHSLLPTTHETGSVLVPTLQMRKLRNWEFENLLKQACRTEAAVLEVCIGISTVEESLVRFKIQKYVSFDPTFLFLGIFFLQICLQLCKMVCVYKYTNCSTICGSRKLKTTEMSIIGGQSK